MYVTGTVSGNGLTLSRVYRDAGGITLDRIGRECVAGIPCDQDRYFIEPDFPHANPRPRPGEPRVLYARCWRHLLYKCARHDGTTYLLNEPVVIGPRKTPPNFPVESPYKACCWDYSGSKVYTENAKGEPIYYGSASITSQVQLTGARLFTIISEAWGTCCGGGGKFVSRVPRYAPHNIRVTLVVYGWRLPPYDYVNGQPLRPPGTGGFEYVDTEVTSVTIDRCDTTPVCE